MEAALVPIEAFAAFLLTRRNVLGSGEIKVEVLIDVLATGLAVVVTGEGCDARASVDDQ